MRRLTALTATLTAIAALAACSDDSDPADSADSTDSADVSTTPASGDFDVVGAPYLTGPGRWAMKALSDPRAHLAVFDVPADFQGHEQWIWFDVGDEGDGEFGQLMYLAPTAVPQDPCRPNRPGPELGSGIDDLASALAAQRRTTTTRPVAVSLGGHDGLYLELTTPSRSCPADTGHLVMWAGSDDARELDPNAVDRYWILDVEGHRVVISAMTMRDGNDSAVRRVRAMAESVTFVPAT